MSMRPFALACGLCLLTGCAGVAPTQMGQMAGTIVGSVVAPGVGAPIGNLIGMLAGMAVQKKVDKALESRERKELSDQLARESSKPMSEKVESLPTIPTRVWVDEDIEHGRLVAGHFEERQLP